MKIFVAGATGRVGQDLVQDLVKAGHQVVAGSRHPEKLAENDHVTAVKLDLHASVDEIAKLMQGSQAVYFTAGSRGHDLLQTDAFGAVKTMQAAEKLGIKRYVMLSSMYALQPDEWYRDGLKQITDYNIAKYFADHYLSHDTQLDYTILQATGLTEEAGTGKINAHSTEMTTNPIPDVAQTLAKILDHDNTIGKVIMMSAGQVPIDDALDKI